MYISQFLFISNIEDFQYNKALEKQRVTGNGKIIQSFSIKIQFNNIYSMQMCNALCFLQREVTRVQCKLDFSQN
jgi:hypothetical protein